MASLTDPVEVAGRTAPSRVVFGPHETNLARRREVSDRHVAYYRARAAGGAGIVVTETASVHPSDWPYERAPLAEACGPGWSDVANACHGHGSLVLAGLGHSGGQGSSAYSQSAMWAPSRVADVVSREMPVEMEREDIEALVLGFAGAARLAVHSGLDGVEVDAGYCSLLRQFHSGLTNQRSDEYGSDPLRLTTQVLEAVRDVVGPDRIVALRLCCDELAPWAGVTPEQAAGQVGAVADRVDLVVVVRGGPYSASAYRPDAHTPANFNVDLCRQMRQAADGRAAVVLQGSVTEAGAAQSALDDGVCDLVEMTRSQIAEPRLVALVRRGDAARARPCILCNQACRVRDNRNPLVSCVGEPASGHETTEAVTDGTDGRCREVMVVGAGVAGLECARVLSARGHRVRVVERSDRPGGALRAAAVGPGRQRLADLTEWLIAECRIQGVAIETGVVATEADLDTARAGGAEVVLATGSLPAPPAFPVDGSCPVVDVLTVLTDGSGSLGGGPVVVHDPIGGPIGVGIAEWLAASGLTVSIVTPDQIAGTLLSLSGDLADANTRLQRAGVRRELRALLRGVEGGHAVLEDVWTGERRTVECGALVDCGHRLPDEALYLARPGTLRAGDCVAPRGVLEAVLEGRRRAMDIAGGTAGLIPAGVGAAS
ncbi:MAG TPA: mycofactocin system FadH/OYE family oxidoreductase 1 [Acidimicrobiales bacterium]|nr:mycofactocin system FadH/OYE family oxidoreductase 1 [Acidimicrobiales bacterium]